MKDKVKKYVTIADGNDFRSIARIMTGDGFRMNHATARNVFMNAMRALLKRTSQLIGNDLADKQIDLMLKNQEVYECLSDLLYRACTKED